MASPASNASRGHETGAAAASSAGSPPASTNRPAVDVTAITIRDDFLLELGEALGGQASVRPVDSIAGALEYLANPKRGQLLVIDTRDVGDVRTDVELAHAQAPHAVVLVFTGAETEKQVSAAVKGSSVFAVLTTPIDKRKASTLLDGAMTEAVAKKATARMSPNANPGMTIEAFQPRADAPVSQPPPPVGQNKTPLWIGLGVAAVALVGGGGYFFFASNDKGAAPPPAATAPKVTTAPAADTTAGADQANLGPQPAVDTGIVSGKVDELLEKARLAMRERRYLEPVGDNALLYYRSAAAADPNSGEAKDGLQRVAGVSAARFDEAMNAGKYDEASLALANLKVAAPDDPRIGPSELRLTTAQIAKALADSNIDRATALVRQAQTSANIPPDQLTKWRNDIARHQEDAKVQKLAALVADRIRDGRLIDPPDDSAKTYVQQLHDGAPSNPNTQRAMHELGTALLHKAKEAAIAKNGEMDHWVSEARPYISAAEINAFQRDLASQRQKAIQAESDHLALGARERINSGRLTDPSNDSAAYFLTQLQATDPSNPQLAPLSRDLASKLLDRARTSAQGGKPALVDPDLTQAKRWGADPKDILAVQQIQPIPKPAATGGSVGRSSAVASGLTPAQLAATLKRTKYTPPEFPAKALAQRVSGSVTVEYVVDTNGDPRDVRVVEATPPGVFDRAAITAVKRWHYEPVVANGAPVEVPVRTAIRFELPSQ